MTNSILLLVFNYSNCLNNKQKICDLYKDHFKKIIVYSDTPQNTDEQLHEDVNYVDIKRGTFVHRIFNHFYDNHKDDLNECDGLFYTSDDNIINVNILNLYSDNKIISFYQELHELNFYSGWHWDHPMFGKAAVNKIDFNNVSDELKITKFCGKPEWRHAAGVADFFYLPKRYLTQKLFDLFDLFSNVYLEIAIPTIINNIETNKDEYCKFTYDQKCSDTRKALLDKNNIYKSLNFYNNLVLHPIKFNQNPQALDWLSNAFQKKKCVIITTINEPTETIRKHISNSEYDVIIVGDLKTPDTYKNEDCIFLNVENQKKMFPELCDLIPYNHYGRKNLGYLYAIKKGYEVIYETDDDNIPHDNFDSVLELDENVQTIKENNSSWINIFKYFTNNSWIWPRGYPLSCIKKNSQPNYSFDKSKNKNDVAIINGLVENDPDVDAIFRLVCNHAVVWEKGKNIIISNENTCPFNTQNTFWLDPNLFLGLLLPCSVTFRYCDILKGIVANALLKHNNKNMAYISPNVTQLRNEHDLMQDFESEVPMYLANETIVDVLGEDVLPRQKSIDKNFNKELMRNIYQKLFDKQIITELDLKICETWLKYF